MELFTKKNILISLAVIIAIPVVFTVGSKAYRQIDFYFYAQAKKPAIELGKDYESLVTNLHLAFKEKNKDNAYALHCLDGGNDFRSRKGKDKSFEKSWEQIKKDDYSQSTAVTEEPDEEYSRHMVIDNIRTQEGETKSRKIFITDIGKVSEGGYKCASF